MSHAAQNDPRIPQGYALVDPATLSLPACPIPRPGDSVSWYADSNRIKGKLMGHTSEGRPLLINQFGNPVVKETFEDLRLENSFKRVGPNWITLPQNALILRPTSTVIGQFVEVLSGRVPPGPTYFELIEEIWSRGFEVFVVGGTVRDALGAVDSQDVDIVTTMPLNFARRFLPAMYRYEPTGDVTRGFIRIGGTPESGDSFIDIKVFSDSLPGTNEATFGVGFDRDVAHRDFACNAVYYDPINQVIIDPTGVGLADCLSRRLTLICETSDPFQHAQIFWRFWKFVARGYAFSPETMVLVCSQYIKAVTAMKHITRINYLKTQFISKCKDLDEAKTMIATVSARMEENGVGYIWSSLCEPHIHEILQ